MGLFVWLFGPPGPDKFARLLKAAIERAGEKGPIRYAHETFILHAAGGAENALQLTNAYHEYRAAPKA